MHGSTFTFSFTVKNGASCVQSHLSHGAQLILSCSLYIAGKPKVVA